MILLFLLACFFMYKQAKKLVIKKVSVNLGVKIVLLSDLHFDTVLVNHREIIEKICGKVNGKTFCRFADFLSIHPAFLWIMLRRNNFFS